MPFRVDPNTLYPVSTIIVVVLGFFVSLRYFATSRELVELQARMAEKYVLKDDLDKRLDEFKSDVQGSFAEVKGLLNRLFDKIDEVRSR